jgi:NADH dehydrogenase/NADH:ubiquinone oxidoreductase subunit G
MVRRNGTLVEVPWQTALEAAAEAIRSVKPERSALLYSGSCTNEDVFAAHKFAREALKSANVDSSLRRDRSKLGAFALHFSGWNVPRRRAPTLIGARLASETPGWGVSSAQRSVARGG